MAWFSCPYLATRVELTDERLRHIVQRHPEVWPEQLDALATTLADPDEVRTDSEYPRTRLFMRWFDHVLAGKIVIVAVVAPTPPETRHWVVTALASNRPPRGEVEWTRD
jgi:hypothetical protein